ncbi:hypothetical protein F5Y14DRAFT_451237 [Nemania sp. NC0429]|nr:hypothetical protein F5Y14DRAFT_451237 [Nemania sp. NC0429]
MPQARHTIVRQAEEVLWHIPTLSFTAGCFELPHLCSIEKQAAGITPQQSTTTSPVSRETVDRLFNSDRIRFHCLESDIALPIDEPV